jgi:excisionase family DNA binding protein
MTPYRKPCTDLSREPELMTVAQAARVLQLCPESVKRLCRDGLLPAMKIGREWRISREAIHARLEGKTDPRPMYAGENPIYG